MIMPAIPLLEKIPPRLDHMLVKPMLLKKKSLFEKLYPLQFLTAKHPRKVTKLLLKMNTPPTSTILKKYKIEKSDLKTGVICPKC